MKSAPRYVAVIDIGKTNAKVAVVDMQQCCEIAMRSTPNVVMRDGPYPHFDTSALWRFILDALTELRREHPIDAVTATTHGACSSTRRRASTPYPRAADCRSRARSWAR